MKKIFFSAVFAVGTLTAFASSKSDLSVCKQAFLNSKQVLTKDEPDACASSSVSYTIGCVTATTTVTVCNPNYATAYFLATLEAGNHLGSTMDAALNYALTHDGCL